MDHLKNNYEMSIPLADVQDRQGPPIYQEISTSITAFR
jgi:hypothetical protein